jgi:uncharacterized membrane protein YhaH (DUF805 family)
MEWMVRPYLRYAKFTGRSRRREYWLFVLFCILVVMVIEALFGTRESVIIQDWHSTKVISSGAGSLIGNLFALGSIVPSLAVTIRRLHDIDRSGWLIMLTFLPFLGWFTLFVFMCLDGTAGGNRFGPDPKDRGVVEVFR